MKKKKKNRKNNRRHMIVIGKLSKTKIVVLIGFSGDLITDYCPVYKLKKRKK
jgi:hypothetical protein